MKWIPLPVPKRLTAKEIALCGVMAGVMAFAAFIPVTVVAGVGKVISAAVLLEPLIGIILGPLLGIYSAGAGAFVGQIIAPQGAIFGPLTFIPPTVGATTAALLAHKHWKAGVGMMAGVLLLWYSTSIGRELYYYPYLPVIFLGSALLLRSRLGEWIHDSYREVIHFGGAGTRILVAGLLMILLSQCILEVYTQAFLPALMITSLLSLILLFMAQIRRMECVTPLAAGFFFVSAGLSGTGIISMRGELLIASTLAFLCLTHLFLGLIVVHRMSSTGFLLSLGAFGLLFVISLVTALTAQTPSENLFLPLLRSSTGIVLILGILLFSLMYLRKKDHLKKWAGISFLIGGCSGIVYQILSLSADSQVMRRELLGLKTGIPFSTLVEGHEMDIASNLDLYVKKVVPVYTSHVGWLLVFVALIFIGLSLVMNISLEKISMAYFIIAGCAVLSDLMIGNFLAIKILELQAGMFRAFLFIYPVERMFMAFFATIFGMGVIIPLKKFGFINLLRR
ncbi:MAG: hypothetical protein HXS53_03620 [Theionarchaea archaeon]|nr:hypothetical protein [Theionarchaea archaeon]